MEPPSEWLIAIEAIFEQFALHYGAARMAAHWSGLDAEKSKKYWAKKLSGLDRRSLGYALAHKPDHPPTPDEFLAIARRCPPPPVLALEHKRDAGEIARARARANEMACRFGLKSRQESAA